MADALDEVITEITTLMAAMAGIDQAPEYPPEGIVPPVVVTYHTRCAVEYSLSYTRTLHTIHCDVLLPRGVLPHSEQSARPYILRGISAIASSVTLNSDATHCLLKEVVGPGTIPYGGDNWYGVRYILEVKLTNKDLSITVAA